MKHNLRNVEIRCYWRFWAIALVSILIWLPNWSSAQELTSKTIAGGKGQGSAANQLNHPAGLFIDAAGAVYVMDSDNNRVQKFAYDFSTQTYAAEGVTVTGGSGSGLGANQLNHPKGIYQDAPGNLFVADAGNHRVQKFALGSTVGTTVVGGNGPGSAATQLNHPVGVFVNAAGTIYVTDSDNHRVQKFVYNFLTETYAAEGVTVAGGNGSGAADNQLDNPTGIYQDAAGNILVADAGNHRVQKLSIVTRQEGFAIISGSMVSCVLTNPGEYRVTFTPEYQDTDGSPITFRAINESLPTTQAGPYTLRLYSDNPVITLEARQASGAVARYRFAWLDACEGGVSPNRPPTTTGIPDQTLPQGQPYRLDLDAYFSDPDGQQLAYRVQELPAGLTLVGGIISGTPTVVGPSITVVTALDPGGLKIETSLKLTVTERQPDGGNLVIVSVNLADCKTLTPNARQLTLIPVYSGGDGSAITFRIVNEILPTTLPGPYSLRLYVDNPVITLAAIQSGKPEVKFQYNWLAACSAPSGNGRLGATEGGLEGALSVRLLGNPVLNQQINVEITGVEGQALRLELLNTNGQIVSKQSVQGAERVERQTINLSGYQPGLLLLRVSTTTQSRTVKVLNAE